MNRDLYRLQYDGDGAVIVYRNDNDYGRQGVVFADGQVRLEYTPYSIPQYIIKECLNIMNTTASSNPLKWVIQLEVDHDYEGIDVTCVGICDSEIKARDIVNTLNNDNKSSDGEYTMDSVQYISDNGKFLK